MIKEIEHLIKSINDFSITKGFFINYNQLDIIKACDAGGLCLTNYIYVETLEKEFLENYFKQISAKILNLAPINLNGEFRSHYGVLVHLINTYEYNYGVHRSIEFKVHNALFGKELNPIEILYPSIKIERPTSKLSLALETLLKKGSIYASSLSTLTYNGKIECTYMYMDKYYSK